GAGAEVIDWQIHELASSASRMELEQRKLAMDYCVRWTLQALLDIGHYVGGYPGRKNLFWISNAFPIKLNGLLLQVALKGYDPIGFAMGAGYADYQAQIRRATSVLSDAKMAIYPVNPGGVQPHAVYRADVRPSDTSGPGMSDAMSDEIVTLADEDKTMRVVAEDTGGAVCNGSNDLAECFTRAFDDSSSYYEISYYPDLQEWNGEYRHVILHSKRSGVQLEYRHGYYAGKAPWETQKQSEQAELQKAACGGYLGASSVVFAAAKLPADASGHVRFYVDIDPQTITLSQTSDGGREFSIEVAACSFDNKGKPLQLLSQPISGKLTAKEYQNVTQNGLAHVVEIPAPMPAGVRLLVKDIP